jgi:hypothetical protein
MKGGNSKVAKMGMAVGSLMAIAGCACCAVFGVEGGIQEASGTMMEDYMYEIARGLKALTLE